MVYSHLRAIGDADFTNGRHCGYISPIPQIEFGKGLGEQDFRAFIEAISNDIINWDSIRQLMESRLVPRLFACGEVLDVDGNCGGYNLQWAWASGIIAGRLGK